MHWKLSGGAPLLSQLLTARCRLLTAWPSVPSPPPFCTSMFLLLRLTGGGGRGGRVFFFSAVPPRTRSSAMVKSITPPSGMVALPGVIGGPSADVGDSDRSGDDKRSVSDTPEIRILRHFRWSAFVAMAVRQKYAFTSLPWVGVRRNGRVTRWKSI